MSKILTATSLGFALLAGLAITGVPGLAAPGAKAASYVCMTDDGYGRKRPCSANYKTANPNWRATDACMTDDGYGRTRPCSAGYKAKHAK